MELARSWERKYEHTDRARFLKRLRQQKRRGILKSASDNTITYDSCIKLLEKQNYKCTYCGCDLNEKGKHLEHKTPICRGGIHSIENIQFTCPKCNLNKGRMTHNEFLKEKKQNGI